MFLYRLRFCGFAYGAELCYCYCYYYSYYAPPRRGAGALIGDRRPSSVRPSVCLSDVAYIGSNSKTKGLGRRNFAQGYPRSHATPTPTSRSKGQQSRWGGGILWRQPSRTACYNCHHYQRHHHHLLLRQNGSKYITNVHAYT